VEWTFQRKALETGLELVYYRTLKTGYVPMLREVKWRGEPQALNRLKAWLVEDKYALQMVKNPWRVDDGEAIP
jgi:hypothetical protein